MFDKNHGVISSRFLDYEISILITFKIGPLTKGLTYDFGQNFKLFILFPKRNARRDTVWWCSG